MSANGLWIVVLVAGLTFGAVALAVLLRAIRGGAFEDVEDAKYVVFREEDDDEGPPPPAGGRGT